MHAGNLGLAIVLFHNSFKEKAHFLDIEGPALVLRNMP
jgi:hypothetical protein